MRLLVDLGNTRVKWRLEDGAGPVASGALAHAAPDFGEAVHSAWRDLKAPRELVLACVGPESAREILLDVAAEVFPAARVREARTAARFGDVCIAYAEPSRFGVDRFLALVAAHRRAPRDQLIVGIGTALTVDALGADGRHHGGLIAPSPALMQQALVGATAGIRPTGPGAIVELAADTADAIMGGTWQAAAGLVERVLARSDAWARTAPALLLAGGDAETLAVLIRGTVELAPDLVLEGLGLWADARADDAPRAAAGPCGRHR